MHSQHDDHKTGTWGQQQTDMQLTGGGTRVVQYGSAGAWPASRQLCNGSNGQHADQNSVTI